MATPQGAIIRIGITTAYAAAYKHLLKIRETADKNKGNF